MLFESIAKEYARYGYKLPKICFWNVCSRNFDTIPMQKNELGLVLCSGFSTTNMRMFMSGKFDPYEILLELVSQLVFPHTSCTTLCSIKILNDYSKYLSLYAFSVV